MAETETTGSGRKPEPTLMDHMGGVSGLVYSALPTMIFVVVNAAAGLTVAVGVAVGAGAGITLLRLIRKEPVQQAISGLLGVALAAGIAYQTGEAKDYFLLGIWMSLIGAVGFLISILARRPVVGVVWNALNGAGQQWRKDKVTLRAYDIATFAFVVLFAARFVVQQWLYDADSTGWLAFARIAMGYPLLALAILISVWAVRRSNKRLKELDSSPAA